MKNQIQGLNFSPDAETVRAAEYVICQYLLKGRNCPPEGAAGALQAAIGVFCGRTFPPDVTGKYRSFDCHGGANFRIVLNYGTFDSMTLPRQFVLQIAERMYREQAGQLSMFA